MKVLRKVREPTPAFGRLRREDFGDFRFLSRVRIQYPNNRKLYVICPWGRSWIQNQDLWLDERVLSIETEYSRVLSEFDTALPDIIYLGADRHTGAIFCFDICALDLRQRRPDKGRSDRRPLESNMRSLGSCSHSEAHSEGHADSRGYAAALFSSSIAYRKRSQSAF